MAMFNVNVTIMKTITGTVSDYNSNATKMVSGISVPSGLVLEFQCQDDGND